MKTRIKKISIFIFFCFFFVNIFGQSFEYFNGKILDSLTKKPIPFATIILKENNLGLYASEEGDFKIKTKPNFQTDTLLISSIGFNQKKVHFINLKIDSVNYIYLSQATIMLKEIQLLALKNKQEKKNWKKSRKKEKISSRKLIKYAIKNIEKNYPTSQFSYVSYYRDYQKSGKEYINLNEALIHTTDNGFKTEIALNKSRLIDFKKKLSFSRKDISFLYDSINTPNYAKPNKIIPKATLSNQGGNEFFILRVHDPIRKFKTNSFSFINIFSKDFLTNHSFSKIEKIYNNDILLFKVKFKSRNWLEPDFVASFGEIIIQPDDYSIHKIVYTGVDKKSNKEIFNVKLEYGYSKSINSLMELKYISFNNLFNLIDETDISFFKITSKKIYDSYLKLEMSNLIDEKSVSKKDNYRIFNEDGNDLKIKNITVKDSTIFVHFKNDDFVSVDNLQFEINGDQFQDIEGNFLNQKKILEFNQYRELFVQEYNPKIKFIDNCYLHNLPLIHNCISKQNGVNKYWMNTPKSVNDKVYTANNVHKK